MEAKIKILIAEHDPVDLELMHEELQKSGIAYLSRTADDEQKFIKELLSFVPDIILADYTFPTFDGPTAFKIRQRLAPDTPFIFVTGTIGEEKSIELIRTGVTDYVLKDKLFTLNHKVIRALDEAKDSRLKREIELAFIESERQLARAQKMAHTGNWELNFASSDVKWSDELFRIYGLSPEVNRQTIDFISSFIHPEDKGFVLDKMNDSRESQNGFITTYRIILKSGAVRNIYYEARVEFDSANNAIGFYGIARDLTELIIRETAIANELLVKKKEITEAMLTALENERSYIGNELNENLNQILATAKMYIQLSNKKEETRQIYLDMSCSLILDTMVGIRRLSKTLVIPATHIISLVDNINNLVQDLSILHPLQINFNEDEFDVALLNGKIQLTVFRIVQEQINNVLVHSNATHAEIHLTMLNELMTLRIFDNGNGCDSVNVKGGVGIINIKTRAELHDGKVTITSSPGRGYELKVELSLSKQVEGQKAFLRRAV